MWTSINPPGNKRHGFGKGHGPGSRLGWRAVRHHDIDIFEGGSAWKRYYMQFLVIDTDDAHARDAAVRAILASRRVEDSTGSRTSRSARLPTG